LPYKLIRYKKYWIAFIAWFILWPVAQACLLVHFGVEEQTACYDSLVSNLLLAFACFDITFILRYYHSKKKGWYMALLWSAGLAAVLLLVMNFIVTYFYSDEPRYILLFQQTVPLRFIIAFIIIVAFVLLDRLLYYVRTQEEENRRKLDLEKLSRNAELAVLRQQLQPHFLFNTLNSISALVITKPEEARRMIQQLSDFLRGTVKKDDKQFVDLASELRQLQLYLDIEKVRFSHRLTTLVECDETCLDLTLPPLLLQPLVENAIKFGLYDTTEAVTIRICAKTEHGQLLIVIENPFDTETAKPQKGTGFGLSSVQRRLYLLFARNDLLHIQTKETVFIVTVKIPQLT
jgi:two-component system, LytTR family, sensor kinase